MGEIQAKLGSQASYAWNFNIFHLFKKSVKF